MRALLDLVLPVSCAACGAPGSLACPPCAATLSRPARLVWPRPSPPDLPPPFAVAPYAAEPRAFLLAYKEDNRVGLRPLLGAALARALLGAVTATTGGPVWLVPVPSTAAARRTRGDDVVARLARWAAADLRSRGVGCAVVPALRHRRAVRDSAGLGAVHRAAHLAGAFRVSPRAAARLGDHPVVLLDDLVTTGATLAECTRTLVAAGLTVTAAATVAATPRRGPGFPRSADIR